MIRTRTIATIAVFAATLGACVVAPIPPHGVVVPRGIVYVAPSYPAPAPGFVWSHHSHHGWGWHHPRRGWHRGWR